MAEVRLAEIRPAEVRLAEIRLTEVRLGEVRVNEGRPNEDRRAEIRVAEVRPGEARTAEVLPEDVRVTKVRPAEICSPTTVTCQKIIVYSADESSVLLCKRKGEDDFDGDYSFIGGKMETTDTSIIEGMKREKDEEVGVNFKIKLFPDFSTNILFTKNDGSAMILPHYYAVHVGGDVELNEEYSEYAWVPLEEVADFEPKISTIPGVLDRLGVLKGVVEEMGSVVV